jgi:hypothetical protein
MACKIIDGKTVCSKSPFEMWGSWIGLIWGIIILMYSFSLGIAGIDSISITLGYKIFAFPVYLLYLMGFSGIFLILLSIISATLIGWGIETLIMRYKK